MFKDRYGITDVVTGDKVLSLSIDDHGEGVMPVIFFKNEHDHDHIRLDGNKLTAFKAGIQLKGYLKTLESEYYRLEFLENKNLLRMKILMKENNEKNSFVDYDYIDLHLEHRKIILEWIEEYENSDTQEKFNKEVKI